MNDAPERIWVEEEGEPIPYEDVWDVSMVWKVPVAGVPEYVRADLYKAQAARIAELEGALSFYASVEDYKAPFTGAMGKLWRDCGETARATLTKEEDK